MAVSEGPWLKELQDMHVEIKGPMDKITETGVAVKYS